MREEIFDDQCWLLRRYLRAWKRKSRSSQGGLYREELWGTCSCMSLAVKVATMISTSKHLFTYTHIKISNFNHFDFTFLTNEKITTHFIKYFKPLCLVYPFLEWFLCMCVLSMCMCIACVCSHVCYAHCVQMCAHVCKCVCSFSELMLGVFFQITLSTVLKQYVLSNLDLTKSRHSCQAACFGDPSLCCWRAANNDTPLAWLYTWVLTNWNVGSCACTARTSFIGCIHSHFFLILFSFFFLLLLHIAFHHVKTVQIYWQKCWLGSTETFVIGDFPLWWK